MLKHFLTGDELTATQINQLVERAVELKRAPHEPTVLNGRSVALIFQKPSTRTRVSFEVGVNELGGHPLILRSDELQLSRGESLKDTALVLSRHVSAIGLRTGAHSQIQELAQAASVPVINMLTADHHPCQALADLMTLYESFGTLAGLKLAYVGDGNNVARSLALLGGKVGVEVSVASPAGYKLSNSYDAKLFEDPLEAVSGADAIYADVWVSMGDEETASQRRRDLEPYRLDQRLLDAASERAVALHCLPAHPGEEITEDLLYGDRQRIWQQAENRRHAQKALLELLINE